MEAVNDRIITLRGQQVIIDRDVAELYGVETKRVNEALKNNREKFPKGYVITLQPTEKQQVVEKFRPVQNAETFARRAACLHRTGPVYAGYHP